MANMPLTPRISPSSPSSPTAPICRREPEGTWPAAARIAKATGRSNAEPSLRTSAGLNPTVMRCVGRGSPTFAAAERTRSFASRTDVSGRPTTVTPGSPGRTCASTCTGTASMPTRANVITEAVPTLVNLPAHLDRFEFQRVHRGPDPR